MPRKNSLLATLVLFLILKTDLRVAYAADDDGDDVVGSSYFLFDIDNDPTESSNLFDDESLADVKAGLEERRSFWQNEVNEPQVPTTDNMYSTFKKLGGIGAWEENDFEPLEVEQIFDNKNAPNIVFVLVDDWGYNDPGYASTYMSWTTPHIDTLAKEGVKLGNYYSNQICIPSRASLMTGRYPLRLGLWGDDAYKNFPGAQLPLTESTLPQELKSAGYRTYAVGKWDLGFSAEQYYPTNRGFDSFYGYFNGMIDYWTKEYDGYLDLHQNDELVSAEDETSEDVHSAYLFQQKAEEAIWDWHDNYKEQPFFLYYATQIIHGTLDAPDVFMQRAELPTGLDDKLTGFNMKKYVALNLMLDEIIANLTCTLQSAGMADNTLIILASDNGGQDIVPGNTYPLRGQKGSFFRGGVSVPAFIHGKMLPSTAWGTVYEGNVHVTDWLPTIMGLATGGQWESPLSGETVDGKDLWEAVTTNDKSAQRQEIVFFSHGDSCALQWENYRYLYGMKASFGSEPEWIFSELEGESYLQCASPSLMADTSFMQRVVNLAISTLPVDTEAHIVVLATGFFFAFMGALYALYVLLNYRNSHHIGRLHSLAPSNSSPYAPLA